jgi:hypothetical protein
MQYVGLLRRAATGIWLSTEVPTTLSVPITPEVIESDDDAESSLGTAEAAVAEAPPVDPPFAKAPNEPERPKHIFIGHGRDKNAVTQLTKILDELGLPYKVAEYEANAGRPISQKVADLWPSAVRQSLCLRQTASSVTRTAIQFGCRHMTSPTSSVPRRFCTKAAS